MLDFLPSKRAGGVLEENEENVSRFFPQGKVQHLFQRQGKQYGIIARKNDRKKRFFYGNRRNGQGE